MQRKAAAGGGTEAVVSGQRLSLAEGRKFRKEPKQQTEEMVFVLCRVQSCATKERTPRPHEG
jgi:hypothetical protein